jgi:hypothetical protein
MPSIRLFRLPRAGQVAGLGVLFFAAAMFVTAGPAFAAQVGLGTADSFAVLAGSGITNTGPTTITGDVGTFPTPSETGFGSITLTGTNHAGDAVTQGAKSDLVTAYNDAAGRIPRTNLPVELGGSTLLAGVYTSPTFGLTGTLTLDAQGNTDAQFVFQAGSTLITASNSRVLLLNGADPCRVVWQVGSSATFNTGTQFAGDVLARTSITAKTGATFRGRLLARSGAVTLDTNTITRANCVVPAGGGTTTTSTTTPGTTVTTAGTTVTTTASITPAGLAGPITPSAAGPGSPTAILVGAPGTPAATPGRPSSGAPGTPGQTTGAPAAPPAIALTGIDLFGLIGAGVVVLAVGLAIRTAGRRGRHANRR